MNTRCLNTILKVGPFGIRLPIPSQAKFPPHLRTLQKRHQQTSSKGSLDALNINTRTSEVTVIFKVHLSITKKAARKRPSSYNEFLVSI